MPMQMQMQMNWGVPLPYRHRRRFGKGLVIDRRSGDLDGCLNLRTSNRSATMLRACSFDPPFDDGHLEHTRHRQAAPANALEHRRDVSASEARCWAR
jgi:hypothetical protein